MKLTLFLSLVLLTNAIAGTRGSTNYVVLSDTLDAGGLRAASDSYANDGTIGGFGGLATANSPQETARIGYAGQLYEITAFTLTAATTNLNEGASLPLYATRFIDDGTVLPANSVAQWSLGGPLASIAVSGLVTAANVYQDTPALVQANLEGWGARLNLLVKNVGNDDYGLYANDGIADWWQVQYFGTNNPNGSGPNVLFNYVAGLDPTNPASVFSVSLAATLGMPSIVFSPRLTSRTYSVEYRTNLAQRTFLPLSGAAQVDNGSIRTVTDVNATNTSRVYRVQISYP